jgi:hypothetical protein
MRKYTSHALAGEVGERSGWAAKRTNGAGGARGTALIRGTILIRGTPLTRVASAPRPLPRRAGEVKGNPP